jgi:hypothetical protein
MAMKHAGETNSCTMVQKVGITEIYFSTLEETERRIKVCQFHTKPSESSNKVDTKMQNFSEVDKLAKTNMEEFSVFS